MDSFSINSSQNIKNNEASKPQISKGQILRLTVLKLVGTNTYQVNIKGKIFNALFKNPPNMGKMNVEVLDTYPHLKLKVIEGSVGKTDSSVLKKFFVGLKKSNIIESLKKTDQLNLKNPDKTGVLKLLKDSGIFFETKLSQNQDVSGDLKLEALKQSDNQLTNNITRVQLMNLLAGVEQYFVFHSSDYDIDEGELIVKKNKGKYGFSVRILFTNIGEVIVHLIDRGSFVDVMVKSETDMKDEIESLSVEGIRVRFGQLEEGDFEEFALEKKAISALANFEVIA